MFYVTKDLEEAAISHRLGNGYPHKCLNLHGHNYHFQVTIRSEHLDRYGMVIDFGTIKKLFSDWIQKNWDHATLVSKSDITLLNFLQLEEQRFYTFPAYVNTTAEYMSKYLFKKFTTLMNDAIAKAVGDSINDKEKTQPPLCNCVELVEVKVWETKSSVATYREES